MRPARVGFFSPLAGPAASGCPNPRREGGNALRHRFARYPRLQRLVIACCALTALAADLAHGAGNVTLARAAFCATFILLPVALLLMRCCLLMDEKGVFIGTPLRRHRLLWRDMGAVGYMQCNARRVYLYGMEKGDDSFARMLHDAPFATPRHFVVPASAALHLAVRHAQRVVCGALFLSAPGDAGARACAPDPCVPAWLTVGLQEKHRI